MSSTAAASPCLPITPNESVSYEAGTTKTTVKGKQGTQIQAVDNGKLIALDPESNCLTINHSIGDLQYCGVSARLSDIQLNAIVRKGQVLGSLGTTDPLILKGTANVIGEITDLDFGEDSPDVCPCVPNCAQKTCGSDGCGGTCGTCIGSQICSSGVCQCVPETKVYNGGTNTEHDRVCGGDSCGNALANTKTCSDKQSCIDYQCKTLEFNCTPTCLDWYECGGDGCGGTCGNGCSPGKVCQNHRCICASSCEGRQCGFNACGDSCGTCPDNLTCDEATGQCKCITLDYKVQETACTESTCNQQDANCGVECHCIQKSLETYDSGCEEVSCGAPDNYGGTCGKCPSGTSCFPSRGCMNAESCATEPSCFGKDCGDDGCGGTCGFCGDGYHCEQGLCVSGSEPKDIDIITKSGCQGVVNHPTGTPWYMVLLLGGLGLVRRRKAVRMQ